MTAPAAVLEPEPTTFPDVAEIPEPPDPPRVLSAFDAALASAYGQELSSVASAPPAASSEDEVVKAPEPERRRAKAKTTFRVVEPLEPPVRAGGPVVELEASLLRGLEPAPHADDAAEADAAAEAPKERKPQPAWRRTAMAELTALATDTDDLTPRRRR